ncbi:hypothetical protein M0812_05465 [Anaeramoeba flamelloides]|uniref:Uncharacterized protein n=1 Tax=Anaeramoeba flamelloides TaxID=1746091 RepID=A0AAV8AAT1_9EUKA|nr:hypothetical protein M0812_05465 [Anaeramoeba flamelloides]
MSIQENSQKVKSVSQKNTTNKKEDPFFVWYENNDKIELTSKFDIKMSGSTHLFGTVRTKHPLTKTVSEEEENPLSDITYFEVDLEPTDKAIVTIGLVDKTFCNNKRIGRFFGNYYAVQLPSKRFFSFVWDFN